MSKTVIGVRVPGLSGKGCWAVVSNFIGQNRANGLSCGCAPRPRHLTCRHHAAYEPRAQSAKAVLEKAQTGSQDFRMADASEWIRTVYIEQDGAWWSMAYPAWAAMIQEWTQNGWAFIDNHPQARRLKHKPPLVRCAGKDNNGYKRWYTNQGHILVRMPGSWSDADIAAEFNQIANRNATTAIPTPNPPERGHAD